jgi:hypothetical protein
VSALARIPVGVLVKRRKATSPWINFTWRPIAALPGEPAAPSWTMLGEDAEGTTFYAGRTHVELYASETSNYRDNLLTGKPKLWVVLRPTGTDPPFAVLRVTADGSEGEGFTVAGDDIVDHVPMPDSIRDAIGVFLAEHHVERPFVKRQRERTDQEILGGRRLGEDHE